MIKQVKYAVVVACIGFATINLVACSSTGDKPKPVELQPVVNTVAIRQAWSVPLPAAGASFEMVVVGNEIVAAARDGQIVRIDATSGQVTSRTQAQRALQAGVGADANLAAVVDTQNDLLVFNRAGTLQWRARLSAQVLAAPIITRDLVIVLSADQNILAFDAASGSKLWANTRTAPALLLNRAGGLVAAGDTVYANLAQGRSSAISMAGASRWEGAVSPTRGANEIERLVDLVGKPALIAGDVCARAFQTGVVCITAANGRVRWQRKANGFEPIAVDDKFVFATESNGDVLALTRDTGEAKWTVDRFKYRNLSAPLALGRNVVFGDYQGFVHILNREDGVTNGRMSTDGSAINTPPVAAGDTLAVRTQTAVFGFLPQ
jgi:outer membrane protein assembly factor BamB